MWKAIATGFNLLLNSQFSHCSHGRSVLGFHFHLVLIVFIELYMTWLSMRTNVILVDEPVILFVLVFFCSRHSNISYTSNLLTNFVMYIIVLLHFVYIL